MFVSIKLNISRLITKHKLAMRKNKHWTWPTLPLLVVCAAAAAKPAGNGHAAGIPPAPPPPAQQQQCEPGDHSCKGIPNPMPPREDPYQVKDLTPRDVFRYMEMLSREKAIVNVISTVFNMEKKMWRGVTESELEKILAREPDGEIRSLLRELALVGDGYTSMKAGNLKAGKMTKSMTLYARRSNGKYDIIVGVASQAKEIDPTKVALAFGSCAAAGALAAAAAWTMCSIPHMAVICAAPAVAVKVGLVTTVAGVAGVTVKAAQSYSEALDDHMTGYMAQKLVDDGILKIEGNQLMLP